MDYALAIRRYADQLKDIVLALFTLARMRVGGSLFTLPRSTLAAIMLVLRPAESAVRRLIVIAAQGLAALPPPCGGPKDGRDAWLAPGGGRERSEPVYLDMAGSYFRRFSSGSLSLAPPTRAFGATSPQGGGGAARYRAFQLFDPLKAIDPEAHLDTVSFVIVTADDRSTFQQHPDNTPVYAAHIGHRLNALIRALNNIPYQARRLARWQAKRDVLLKAHHPTRFSPVRPSLPPGWRQRKRHEVDDTLRECHRMVMDVLSPSTLPDFDTS